jgi:hypothetical protein
MTTELLKTFESVQSIFVVGRRWFERTNGNTYHSAEIYVNNDLVHKIDFNYGYGNQFEWNAMLWLSKNGYLKGYKESSPSLYCRDNGISYNSTVTDVKRKKDL